MKNPKTTLLNFSKGFNLTCKLFNDHDFTVTREFDENIMKLHCTKCQKTYGANVEKNVFFDWDDELEKTADLFFKLGA
jgi:hypothetical protein